MRLILSEVLVFVVVLLLLAYFTILERKVLGYGQIRKGPNKVIFLGLGQPVADGVKLMMKSFVGLKGSLVSVYLFMPILVFFIIMGI